PPLLRRVLNDPQQPEPPADPLPPPSTTLTPSTREPTGGSRLSDEVSRTSHDIDAADGYRFNVRVHRPKGVAGALPALVWMHGGGMVAGTNLQDDARFDVWSRRLGIVGVSVDYGLSPERPYPGPLEDCYAALGWAHEHAAELGIRRDAIGIGGSSAGGNLTAGLALLARDRGEHAVAFQTLVYPMIDDRMTTPSSQWDVPLWPASTLELMWNCYLEGRRGGPDVDQYASPGRATDLRGLPPAFMCVGTLDGFLDEDVTYAQRMIQAGVPVELHVYPGAPHGFDLYMPESRIGRRGRRHLEEWLADVIDRLP
ncbi:MAG: alpha/beta hydrolase, partial [Desertimonas sp.]